MATRETVVKHLSRIPDDAMDVILDFIDFVAERHGTGNREESMEKLQEQSMIAVWDNPEDEVWNDVPIR